MWVRDSRAPRISGLIAWWSSRARIENRLKGRTIAPVDGRIDGVRTVLTGHTILDDGAVTANVWHLDTGAGFRNGRLTVARTGKTATSGEY